MKIKSVTINRRKKSFEVTTYTQVYSFPFAQADPQPSSGDGIIEATIDPELGREGFSYRLTSGREGVVLMDHVLEYNKDPKFMRDLLLYKLTLEAQNRVKASALAKREIVRRLGTSPAQFYRLLDQTNYSKSVDQMLMLLHVLDCDIDLVVHAKSA